MIRPKTGLSNNARMASKTINNINTTNTSNYQISKKQNDKNKKQIELKSKIDIPIDDHNTEIKKEKIKQLIQDEFKRREESKRGYNISKSKEKVHLKTLSEIPKTMSNIDTSEHEDEHEDLISVSYNNRLHNKNSKFMNLKKKNENLTLENESIIEENSKKKTKILVDYSKTDTSHSQNKTKGYNLLNYRKHISPFLKSKITEIEAEKIENLVTDDVFMKDHSRF